MNETSNLNNQPQPEEKEAVAQEAPAPEKNPDEMSFAELLERGSLDQRTEGDVVKGRVITIDGDQVMVDIGYKSEGIISLNEFRDESGSAHVKVGDEVEVLLESVEDDTGMIALSKEKADKMKVWDDIYKATTPTASCAARSCRA